MKILKQIIFLFLFLITLCSMSLSLPKQSYAKTCGYDGGCVIYISLDNTNDIKWQVHYWGANDDTLNVKAQSDTVWIDRNSSYIIPIEGIDKFGDLPSLAKVTWATSCADPQVSTTSYTGTVVPKFDGGFKKYYYHFNISCKNPSTCGSTLDPNFAACKYLNYTSSYRSISFTQMCPQNHNPQYCANSGWIWGGTCAWLCNTTSSCTGTCHKRGGNDCSGSAKNTTCSYSTWTDNSCTAGCCAYSSDPGTPSLNNATGLTCVGDSNPNNVTVSWDATARTTNYTAQYRDCGIGGGSCPGWTSVDRNMALSYTIPVPNTDQNHTYQWRVKADNCHGTTYSGIKSFVVPMCPSSKGSLDGASCVPPDDPVYHTTSSTPSFWGWACQGAYNNFSTKLTVTLKDGATTLGTTVANLSARASVDAACGGSSSHQFLFNAPASVIDNSSHAIHAYAKSEIDGTLNELSNSPRTLGPCMFNITANVYQDLNGNKARDVHGVGGYVGVTEPMYSGATVKINGVNDTTNAAGQVISADLFPATYPVNLTVPTNYVLTTPASPNRTATVGPGTTLNFGIRPPAPICSGGLTVDFNSRNPGQVSTLTANNCVAGGQGGTLTYDWLASSPLPGAITSTTPTTSGSPGSSTAIWTAPNPYFIENTYGYPTVNVCQANTTLCTPYGISNGLGLGNGGIKIVPIYNLTGDVFVDQNKDGIQQAGTDLNYQSPISITSTGGNVTYPAPAGNYKISNLPGGTYKITYTNPPPRYEVTNPKGNLGTYSFTVTVGNGTCTTNGAKGASCDVNGNITGLNFGISNSLPWIQAIGGDITGASVADPTGGGFYNPIPQDVPPGKVICGTNTSLLGTVVGSGATPGVIFSGAGAYDFGFGQASQNPYNWIVGGVTYPDVYSFQSPGVMKTSYNYVSSIANSAGITPTDLAPFCGGGGLNNCQLIANLPNGFYIAEGGLNLKGSSYTFPAKKNFVILVHGNLNIGNETDNTEIHVPKGSTATFITSGDISVGKLIGEVDPTKTRFNIEGYYSTDKHFYVKGSDSCPANDRRLNVAGSIVVNAGLNDKASMVQQGNFVNGGFVNERDLCAQDLSCPAFSIIERPDFIINAPDFFKTTRRVWKEIAP